MKVALTVYMLKMFLRNEMKYILDVKYMDSYMVCQSKGKAVNCYCISDKT
jgi:hypothetical protein